MNLLHIASSTFFIADAKTHRNDNLTLFMMDIEPFLAAAVLSEYKKKVLLMRTSNMNMDSRIEKITGVFAYALKDVPENHLDSFLSTCSNNKTKRKKPVIFIYISQTSLPKIHIKLTEHCTSYASKSILLVPHSKASRALVLKEICQKDLVEQFLLTICFNVFFGEPVTVKGLAR